MTNQTTTNTTRQIDIKTICANMHKYGKVPTYTAPTAPTRAQDTTDHLTDLCNRRNDLLKVVDIMPTYSADLADTIHELTETVAQIAVYKTLQKLTDSPKDIGTNGVEKCEQMLKAFPHDIRTYKTQDTSTNYSDAFDLFQTAYIAINSLLCSSASLTLADTVFTEVLKNGNEKNYTLFALACKNIREYIHGWSKTDGYKKLHYIIGIADNGQQVTTSKRPQDDLTDIPENTKKAFFDKYGLTAQQQEIFALAIRGEDTATIADLLNIPLRTVQDNLKKGKAKFATASAYAEYITAKNAEKTARAKAEKHTDDAVYQEVYTRAKARTEKAYSEWVTAFHKGV